MPSPNASTSLSSHQCLPKVLLRRAVASHRHKFRTVNLRDRSGKMSSDPIIQFANNPLSSALAACRLVPRPALAVQLFLRRLLLDRLLLSHLPLKRLRLLVCLLAVSRVVFPPNVSPKADSKTLRTKLSTVSLLIHRRYMPMCPEMTCLRRKHRSIAESRHRCWVCAG